MTKTERFRRRLENCYIKITVPKLIQFLKNNGKDEKEIVPLSDKIPRLRSCLQYINLKIVQIRYSLVFYLSDDLEKCFGIPWTEFARILLSPILPKAELRDDELKLIRGITDNYYDTFTMTELKRKIGSSFDNTLAIKTSYENLIEQGIITVADKKASIVSEFRSPFKIKEEEDLPEDKEWYFDDTLTLQYGDPPVRQGTLFALFQSIKKAEERYQKEWWAPIEKESTRLREIFEKDLEGLKKQSRDYYLSDINWFIYNYFYYETVSSIHEASKDITAFFNYFYKYSRHSEYIVKRMISVIKRFYTVMYKNGEVTKEEYDHVISQLTRNKDMYIANTPKYRYTLDPFDILD